MKKHITLLAGLLVVSGAFAQKGSLPTIEMQYPLMTLESKVLNETWHSVKNDGDLLFEDDFSVASHWTTGTSGQGTFELGTTASPNYGATMTDYFGTMNSTTAGNGFAFFNGVQYLIAANVDPQNTWVASDTIDVTSVGAINIMFDQRYRAFNSDVTYVEFSTDGGVTWGTSIEVNTAVQVNSAVQNTVSIDFAIPSGSQYGMVRFRWVSNSDNNNIGSGYGWAVDDVKVYSGYGNNLTLETPHSYIGENQYTQIPKTQSVSGQVKVSFGVDIKNSGYNAQQASVNVTSGSYDQSSAETTLAPYESTSLNISAANGFTVPATVGVNNFTFTAESSSNTLDVTTDDTKTMPFMVTEGIMAHDFYDGTASSMTGVFGAYQGQNQGDLTGVGSYFEIFEDGVLTGAQVGIANYPASSQTPYIGNPVFVTVLKYNGSNFEYYSQTDDVELEASHFGQLINFTFDDEIAVTEGDLFIILANGYIGSGNNANVPIAFAGTQPDSTALITIGDDYPTSLAMIGSSSNTVSSPVVRLDFQSHVGIADVNLVSGVTTAPNPFSNETRVSFNLKNDAEVSLVVTDLAGRTVYTVTATDMIAGNQSIDIDGTALTSGVYNYTLNVGNTAVTNRIVKK